jgi:hypothetical protein
VRELKAFARLSPEDHVPETIDGVDIHAAGYVMTRQTAEELDRLDLAALTTCPAPEVLIVDRDDRPPAPQLVADLEKLGSRVTQCRPAGTADMLLQPALSKVPDLALTAIATWLGNWQPAGPKPAERVAASLDASPSARGPGYVERAVRFGPGERLFGILTTPATMNRAAPSIIFLTTGTEYHIGPNRLYVPLARSWAEAGHLVLRFDLGGIGEPKTDLGLIRPLAPGGMIMHLHHDPRSFGKGHADIVRQPARSSARGPTPE